MVRDTKIKIYRELHGLILFCRRKKTPKNSNNLERTKLSRDTDISVSKMRRNWPCEKYGKEESKLIYRGYDA